MIKLNAVFIQRADRLWDASIVGIEHIQVVAAEDLETAKIWLDKITAEEIAQMTRGARANWMIDTVEVMHFTHSDTDKTNLLKNLI